MRKRKTWQYWILVAPAMLLLLIGLGTAAAESSSSAHYKVDETQFGSGAALQDCSANYCAKVSIGDTTVGRATSAHYFAQFGLNTTDVPLLEVITQGGDQNLGFLDVNSTGTATNTIKVRNYLSSGYTVQITGQAPNQGTHTMNTITTPSTSHQGAEQFGINLVANTAPSIGTNPVQVPSNLTSFGEPTSDYDTPNLFKYIDGDIVASSSSSSGETDYTMSMIFNVSNTTPGGHYDVGLSAVVVPVY